MKVITFSRVYPSYHPRKGEPTYFVEKIWESLEIEPQDNPIIDKLDLDLITEFEPKYHTIRAGNRWKVGDFFSPRVWSGQPYKSKQIEFAPPIKVKKVWKFEITPTGSQCAVYIDSFIKPFKLLDTIAINDGLSRADFNHWFSSKEIRDNGFTGQIICWNENVNY